jgi:serine/threonine protein kinase/WD40 repeat protein
MSDRARPNPPHEREKSEAHTKPTPRPAEKTAVTSPRFARLEELFLEVVVLTSDERDAFLGRACAGDAGLERELRAMLDAHETADEALPTPPPSSLGSMDVVTTGLVVGGCTLERVIGHGGMGVVYEATQDVARRRVAVKLLPPGLLSSRMLPRFEVEVEAMSRLHHPGIVQVYSAGTVDLGFGVQPFFVMELIDGVSLRETLHEGPLDVDAARRVLVDLADAVHHAHQRGVIHRDLKPENVLIDADGRPHVVDFGIAKIAGEHGDPKTRFMTRTDERVYTIAYAAPEQLSAARGAIDVRTDVYALGVIGYELMAGGRPYPTEGAIEDIIHSITSVRPDTAPLRSAGAGRDLTTVVLKALMKEPSRRYDSAALLRADLVRTIDGAPIAARRDSPWYLITRTLWRHRKLAGSALLALLAIMVATVLAISSGLSAQRSARNLQTVLQTERVDRAIVLAGTDRSREAESVLWPELIRLAEDIDGPVESLDDAHPNEPAHWRHVVTALRRVYEWAPCVRAYPVPPRTSMRLVGAAGRSRHVLMFDANDAWSEWTLDVPSGAWERTGRRMGPNVLDYRLAPGGEVVVLCGRDDETAVLRAWAPGGTEPAIEAPAEGGGALAVGAQRSLALLGNRALVVDHRDWSAHLVPAPETLGAALIPGRDEAVFAGARRLVRGSLAADATLSPFEPSMGYRTLVVVDAERERVITSERTGLGVIDLDDVTADGVPESRHVPLRFGPPRFLALDAEGGNLAVTHFEGNITVLDLAGLADERVLAANSYWRAQRTFVPAPDWLVSGGREAPVRVWDLSREPQIRPAGSEWTSTGYVAAAYAHDGALRAAGQGGWVAWEDGAELRSYDGHAQHASGVAALGDSDDFVTIGSDGALLRWAGAEPEQLGELPGRLYAVAASTDGAIVGVGGQVVTERLQRDMMSRRRFESGALLEFIDLGGRDWDPPRTNISVVRGIAFEPNGDRVVACGTGSPAIECWSLDGSYDGAPSTLARVSVDPRAIAWSPDGSVLAVGCDDGRVWIIDAHGAEPPRLLGTHAARVHAVAFSPRDSDLLVSGSLEGDVRLWDVGANLVLGELLRADPRRRANAQGWWTGITDLEFTPDGEGVLVIRGEEPLGVVRLDYFDTHIAGNVHAWLAEHGDDSPGATRLRDWARQRLAIAPHPLWLER